MPTREGVVLRLLPFGLALVACTHTEAEDYALEDAPAAEWPSGLLMPDGEPAPRVAVVPVEEPEGEVEHDAPRIRVAFDPEESCRPSFEVTGFPAIDVEAGLVVVPLAHMLQLSYTPGSLDLVWLDAQTGEEVQRDVLLGEDDVFDDPEAETQDCRRSTAAIRRAVRAANRELRSGAWTTMEPLPVELYYDWDNGLTDIEYREQRRPRERPVQVLVQHGHAIARVLGVKVLERDALPRGMTMAHAVYAHRPTGTVLFGTRDCAGDSCTCDPRSKAAVLQWKPETFAAIDATPCIVDPAARTDFGTNCDTRPVPFDDFDSPLWAL